MKNVLIIAAAFMGLTLGQAQNKAPVELKKEIASLAPLTGQWKGTATIRQPDGTTHTANQTESITFKLDSTLLIIEGKGIDAATGNVMHHAFAIVSYNQQERRLLMTSHLADGKYTEAYFKVIDKTSFEWGFETPTKAKIKYAIKLSDNLRSWSEKGLYSPDGNNWYPFFEMNLTKQ